MKAIFLSAVAYNFSSHVFVKFFYLFTLVFFLFATNFISSPPGFNRLDRMFAWGCRFFPNIIIFFFFFAVLKFFLYYRCLLHLSQLKIEKMFLYFFVTAVKILWPTRFMSQENKLLLWEIFKEKLVLTRISIQHLAGFLFEEVFLFLSFFPFPKVKTHLFIINVFL